jgi:hydroxymethylpyrimidine pyrophosphatase-like HAD family hydrolase
MLEYAGLGVAMLNSDDIVKQSAQLTTLAGNDDVRVLADLIDEIFQYNFGAA